MSITAFPVLTRILLSTRLYGTRLGVLTLTCAAIDDVTAWSILTVVIAVARSTSVVDGCTTLVLSALFAAVLLGVVRPVWRQLAESGALASRDAHSAALVLLGILVVSWTSELIGSHAVFGAFLLGVVAPRSTALAAGVKEKLEGLTVALLLPVYFAVVGLAVQVGLLSFRAQWLLAGLVLVVAVVGKWAGATLAARAVHLTWSDANVVGILMNTRGVTEIVVLSVGRQLGIVSPALFSAMILMALFTTFMATPLVRHFQRSAQPEQQGIGAPAEPTCALATMKGA